MGLDQYLNKKRDSHGEYFRKDGEKLCKRMTEDVGIAYWRKFNALHAYIVETFANEVDDCKPIMLSTNDILQILTKLRMARDAGFPEALEVLPPQSGLFFGATQFMNEDGTYDQDLVDWYMNDITYSIKAFESARIALTDTTKVEGWYGWEVYYQASW